MESYSRQYWKAPCSFTGQQTLSTFGPMFQEKKGLRPFGYPRQPVAGVRTSVPQATSGGRRPFQGSICGAARVSVHDNTNALSTVKCYSLRTKVTEKLTYSLSYSGYSRVQRRGSTLSPLAGENQSADCCVTLRFPSHPHFRSTICGFPYLPPDSNFLAPSPPP